MGLPATSWRHMWRISNAEDICLISPGSVYNYRLAGRTSIVSRIIEIINLKRNKTESNMHWEILSISSWSPYAFQFNSVTYVTVWLDFWIYFGNRVQSILSMNNTYTEICPITSLMPYSWITLIFTLCAYQNYEKQLLASGWALPTVFVEPSF